MTSLVMPPVASVANEFHMRVTLPARFVALVHTVLIAPYRSRGRADHRVAAGTAARIDPVPVRGGRVTRVAVLGAKGRMGGEVCRTVEAATDLDLHGQVD